MEDRTSPTGNQLQKAGAHLGAAGSMGQAVPVRPHSGPCAGRQAVGQERFLGEHGWEPGVGGQERGAPSTARRAWGREAALHADTKSCNYIVTAQKQESWERLRLGNQCWYHRRCRSPLLLVLPASQRVSSCPLPPVAARRCLLPMP